MRAFVAAVLFSALSSLTQAEEFVQLETRPGVQQGFLLIEPDGKPTATVVLFAGGHGNLKLDGTNIGYGQKHFLIRNREQFAAQDLLVAVVDAPSDRKGPDGMLGGFRASAEHVTDIDAVIADLRRRANVPVWLVGFSRGTESAAYVALHSRQPLGGLVLTSSMTSPNANGVAVTEMELGRLRLPTLVVAHREDGCHHTPASGAEQIRAKLTDAPKVEARYFEGGDPPRSKPCFAMSQHGFLGIESEVVKAIASFIRSNDVRAQAAPTILSARP